RSSPLPDADQVAVEERAARERSGLARLRPDVDVGLGRVLVVLRKLLVGEIEVVQRRDVRLQLLDARSADQCRRDARIAKGLRQGELCDRLTAAGGDLVQ